MMSVRICLGVATMIVFAAAPADAQESRAEVIERQQSEKVKQLRPAQPGPVEAWVVRVKNDMLVSPSGFYPTFDTVYSGGGFTLGAGYRRYYADSTFWNVQGSYSIEGYKHVQVGTLSHGWLQGRLDVAAHVGWRDATRVDYFGLGMATSADNDSNFRFKQTYVGGGVHLRPVRWVRLSGGADYEAYTDEPGTGSSPSIELVHTPATAPGLGEDPSYLHLQGTAGVDWRTSPDYSRRGGYYGATLHAYSGLDEAESFEQLQVDAVQHLPILRENWVVSVRGRLLTTLGDEDLVPYYLLPRLGGGSSLRGYSTGRFRDRHSLLTSIEWRWIPNLDGLDLAIFYDTGEVARRIEDFDLEGWRHNWGFGARFHGPMVTPLRIEIARGSEGWHLIFAGSAAF